MTPVYHFLLIMWFSFGSQSNEWKHEFEKEGITVYTKLVEGSGFKAFRGEMEVEATVDELKTVLMDVENYPVWCYKTSSIKILKKENDRVNYYYISEAPIVVKNREAYYMNKVSRNELTNEVTISMCTYPCDKVVPDGFVRIPVADGYWELTPLPLNKTRIVFQMQAEPGGLIPSWLANLAVVESPLVTLRNLRKVVIENQIRK